MANKTFRNIQDNVLGQISKSDSITRDRVKRGINMGYQDFFLRELWPFREKTGTLSTVQGIQEYSLLSNFSDMDAQNIIAVSIQGANPKKLAYWPYNQLRNPEPDFQLQGQDVPQRYYIKSGQIGFWPIPSGEFTVAIDYYATPIELVNDSDEPIIPEGYREALMQYSLSHEHDFNTDPDLAQKAMNRYEQIVSLARQNLLSQPNDEYNFRLRGAAEGSPWTGLTGEI